MDYVIIIAAGFFLPLFPFSMVFNYLYQRVSDTWMRVVMLMIWPLPGLWMIQEFVLELPSLSLYWALATSLLYSIRALVVKELNIWVGFNATSIWALTWVVSGTAGTGGSVALALPIALSFSLALLTLVLREIEKRYGAAYAGVVQGVAQANPRLGGILAFAMLAAIGMPAFPLFFAMFSSVLQAITVTPVAALTIVLIWFLWGWSGMQVSQKLLAGTNDGVAQPNLTPMSGLAYMSMLLVMALAGILLSGVLL